MRASSLRRHASLVSKRVSARRSDRPQLAVVAGLDGLNLGDELMFEAMGRLLPSADLVPADYPATEARLERLDLSGQAVFAGVVIGGGTLINFHFHRIAAGVLDGELPAWTLGTGVGSTGFAMAPEVEIGPWAELLSDFERVWVRGPLSAERLRRVGIERVEVSGDLALALAPVAPFPPPNSGAIGVNLGSSRSALSPEAIEATGTALADALRPFVAEGRAIVPFGMHPDDREVIAALDAALDGSPAEPVFPAAATELWNLLGEVEIVVGVRLHAAVLSWAAGVPALLFAYRDKCRDFAMHLGVEDCLIEPGADAEAIEAAIRGLLIRGRQCGVAPHAKAREARATIEAAAAEIEAKLRQR
jgi:hypothetical protein